jgi:hypothetical protein
LRYSEVGERMVKAPQGLSRGGCLQLRSAFKKLVIMDTVRQ